MKINLKYYKKIPIRKKEEIIKYIKDTFEKELAGALQLERVSAPLFVSKSSGINDDLNGTERKVVFDTLYGDEDLEVIQSLAKWKRMALKDYGYKVYEGIYTDMNAIRRDDLMDEIHSLYVDQWDWEKVIKSKDRNIDFLKQTVSKIMNVISKTNEKLKSKYSVFDLELENEVFFITSEQLIELYPDSTSKMREYLITKEKKCVFIIGIGHKLSDKNPHDLRAPDYDDWDLNGDLLLYNPILDIALEISSMGIRVDKDSLLKQLEESNSTERMNYPYHLKVLNNELPLTIGGGIGQSRICLQLMQQAHIGEVSVSYWTKEELKKCYDNGIKLL